MSTKGNANGDNHPQPYTFTPSGKFEGNDGMWSTFVIQLGNPAQNARILPAASLASTIVMGPEACPQGLPLPPTGAGECSDSRGLTFEPNASSSWSNKGDFGLDLNDNLGLDDVATFGFDDIALGWQGGGGPSQTHQVVGTYDHFQYWLGMFGVSPQPVNFTSVNDPQTSYMQSLQDNNLIPSLSWSYTAGAYYRDQHIPGSFILGGYDRTLKQDNKSVSVPYSGSLTVGLNHLRTNATAEGLLAEPINAVIDTTIPFMYLPQNVCQAFEKVFNLTWDSTWELYMVDEQRHQALTALNPNFQFDVGSYAGSTDGVAVTLPYSAFDLTASYPYLNSSLPPFQNSSRYFPLRRAQNDTQYTLGRAFLQEAYLIVDYERNNFTVSNRIFPRGGPAQQARVVPITSPNAISDNASHLSGGVIAAIVVGIVAFIAVVGLLIFGVRWYRLKNRPPPPAKLDSDFEGADAKYDLQPPPTGNSTTKNAFAQETDSRERVEIGASREIYEAAGEQRVEMPGSKGMLWHEGRPASERKEGHRSSPAAQMRPQEVFELADTGRNEQTPPEKR